MVAQIVIGGARLISKIAKTRSGRVSLRFTRGMTTHTAGQAAVRGVQRALPKSFSSMSKDEQWVANQCVELAVRIVANLAQDQIEIHVSEDEVERSVDQAVEAITTQILNAISSRAMSVGYEFAFGKIDRAGRLVVGKDVIKQCVLSGVGEVLNFHVNQTA